MTIATAPLTDTQHARFMNDIGHLDWSQTILVTREGGTTIVSNKGNLSEGNDGRHFFTRSLEDGLLHTWGYDKLFTLSTEVA